MNHTFFIQLESHLNAERLAAYSEDGVDDVTCLAHINWMNPELAQLTQMLDRFTDVRSTGLRPWRQKLTNGWPANTAKI